MSVVGYWQFGADNVQLMIYDQDKVFQGVPSPLTVE